MIVCAEWGEEKQDASEEKTRKKPRGKSNSDEKKQSCIYIIDIGM